MIGFFGGTFDPIHLGHLNLAIQLKEAAKLKEIWFCPAFCSPFKKDSLTPPQDRLNMLKLTLEGAPGLKVIEDEIVKEGPSYTIDTIRKLMKETGHTFRLILGEDQIENFSKWKEAEELKKLAPPLFGKRGVSQNSQALSIPLFDVSATEVRNRVKAGQWIGHLVPTQVSHYIHKKGLYLDD